MKLGSPLRLHVHKKDNLRSLSPQQVSRRESDHSRATPQGCDNYPNDHIFLQGKSLNAIVWEADTGLMKGPATGDCITNPVEKIGDNQYQFTVPWIREDMAVGDIITVSDASQLELRAASSVSGSPSSWLCACPVTAPGPVCAGKGAGKLLSGYL